MIERCYWFFNLLGISKLKTLFRNHSWDRSWVYFCCSHFFYLTLLYENIIIIRKIIGNNILFWFSGPVTVPMVSTNSSPPIAMPVQVPPGHVVQQIVDENGTLRHVILSPQHPASLVLPPSHNPPHYVSKEIC